jgi:predicted nucleic acid-binding protein
MRLDLTLKLDRGEVEAIGLAKELRADHVLIDERAGTRVAKAEGLRPLSTLAVLSQAASAGLIDLAKTLHDLQTETTFRLTRRLVDHLLEKERERKRRETPS